MTKEERELGGVEFPADADLGLSALDRGDYLSWALQSLRLERMAELLVEYDSELVSYIRSNAPAKKLPAPKPAALADDDDEGHDENFTWFDRHMYLDYAFNRLSRPEIVRLLKHCEPDLLGFMQAVASAPTR